LLGLLKGAPWVPVTLIGEKFIREYALIDTGATYCVIHPEFVEVLGLLKIGEVSLQGFGSRKAIEADLYIFKIDIGGFREKLEVASIKEEFYSEKVPKVIIGRNFLNKYCLSLDGEKICLNKKSDVKENYLNKQY